MVIFHETSEPDADYSVKRGVFIIGKHDERQKYSEILDTWQISVNSDKTSFNASGKVESSENKVYDLNIIGDKTSEWETVTCIMLQVLQWTLMAKCISILHFGICRQNSFKSNSFRGIY